MNAESKAILELIVIAARTPADDEGVRQNPEEETVLSSLAVLIGEKEAAKIAHVNIGAVAMMTSAELRALGLSVGAASKLRAAFKLAIKAANEAPLPAKKLVTPQDVADLMRDRVALLAHEEVWALFLNSNNQVKADLLVSKMGFDSAHVDARVIFHGAIEVRAVGFFLVHNHPSGNPSPSQPDRELTRRLNGQADIMGVKLVDHVIIVRGGFESLRMQGAL